jgi:hypothetical protein
MRAFPNLRRPASRIDAPPGACSILAPFGRPCHRGQSPRLRKPYPVICRPGAVSAPSRPVSCERVRQIELRAFDRLQKSMKNALHAKRATMIDARTAEVDTSAPE